ncbi:MAG: HIT family protein [Nitriliruptorales bacterium]
MATVFTRIIEGELPGRFVWKDDRCVAFLSINPLREGHTLVVPREEVDHWLDASPDLLDHLFGVSRHVGGAIQQVWRPEKVGLMIAGLEVHHLHIHVSPIDGLQDLNFANAARDPDPDVLDENAERIRNALRDLGHDHVAD